MTERNEYDDWRCWEVIQKRENDPSWKSSPLVEQVIYQFTNG